MKIVVRGTNWIGDAVMTIPALRALRRIFPKAHISLHTREWAEGIFRDADFIDEILTFPRIASNLKEVIEQSKALRIGHFDLAVLFPGSFASALTVRFAGIPKRFGYSKESRRIFLTDPIPVPKWKSTRHEVFYYLNLVSAIERALLTTDTVASMDPSTKIAVSDGRKKRARDLLTAYGVDPSVKVIAIGAGSTNSIAKRWHMENYARLNDRLQGELNAAVVLVGSAEDADASDAVFEFAERKPIDLTGKTKLDEAVALLGEVDLLISNDMGLAHVAPAVGTESLVIFGPTDPLTTRPYSNRAKVINKDVECSPCMLRNCPIDHRCMTRILVDEVFDSAEKKLGASRNDSK
ncbi:MAG: lipopolysaccharide heptosyltransferase II [Pyrinomonadaceae bacterium]